MNLTSKSSRVVTAALIFSLGACAEETSGDEAIGESESELSAAADIANLVSDVDRAEMKLTLKPGTIREGIFNVGWARSGSAPQVTVKLDTAVEGGSSFHYMLFHADDYVGFGVTALPELKLQNVYWRCDTKHFDFRMFGSDNDGFHGALRWAADLAIEKFAQPDLQACDAPAYIRKFATPPAAPAPSGGGFPAFTNVFNKFVDNVDRAEFAFVADNKAFERTGSVNVPVVNKPLTGKLRIEQGQFGFNASFRDPKKPIVDLASVSLKPGISAGSTNASGNIEFGVRLQGLSFQKTGGAVRLLVNYDAIVNGAPGGEQKAALFVMKNAAGKIVVDVNRSVAETSDPLLKTGLQILKIPFVLQAVNAALNGAFTLNSLPQGRSLTSWLGL